MKDIGIYSNKYYLMEVNCDYSASHIWLKQIETIFVGAVHPAINFNNLRSPQSICHLLGEPVWQVCLPGQIGGGEGFWHVGRHQVAVFIDRAEFLRA